MAAPRAAHAVVAALVQIANTPTNSVPVVVAPAANQLYHNHCQNSNSSAEVGCFLPAVPAGETLIVQTAGISYAAPPGVTPIDSFVGAPSELIVVPLFQQGSTNFATYYSGLAVGANLAISGGLTPGCSADLNNFTTSGIFQCYVTGYLVPAQ